MLSKCKEYFFIRFMTSRINYSLLFMLIKMNVKKETSFFSNKTSSFFSSPSLWKQKGHLMTYFHQKTSLPNIRANNLFSKKENNLGVARFQKQIILDSHRNNFCFQNARSRFQDLFWTHIPSPKWTKREMREWSFKTIICPSRWQSTLGGNEQYKGQHCIFSSRKREEYFLQQDKGEFWFMKDNLILSASDTECF